MSKETRIVIGAKLKEAREYLDISQEYAAKHVGINRPALSLMTVVLAPSRTLLRRKRERETICRLVAASLRPG